MNKNSFFKLCLQKDGTYLELYPSTINGNILSLDEICNYLLSKKIMNFDKLKLKESIYGLSEVKSIKLMNEMIQPINETMIVTISEDNNRAIGRFYPPSNNGKLLTKDDILSDLHFAGVKYGVMEEQINQFLKDRQYCMDITMAKATMPVEGRDAIITYYFNTDLTAKPKSNEDGSVDFHQLDIISHVNKGDVLAKLTPEDLGQPGMDVLGREIKPKKVQKKILRYGRNIVLSEDGLTMYSEVSGHASLQGDKVFVSDTYEVLADVDSSTGDITYDGNVAVKGNVITGFSIKAKGDIIVDGVVEGASLEAGGQIILKRGIQGMNKGSLYAEGNIVTKFIENSTVTTKGHLTTEAIMHSKVYAKGDINIGGKRGFVTGGEIKSGTSITAKTAGSTMGTATILEVGVDPDIVNEFREIEQKITDLKVEKDKMMQILMLIKKKRDMGEAITQDKLIYIQAATTTKLKIDEELKELTEKYQFLKKEVNNNGNGKIKILGNAFPGVKIIISNVTYYVRSNMSYCQFIREGADIKSIPLM